MDRILRPTGFVIIHDKRAVVDFIKKYLAALRWEEVGTAELQPSEDEDNAVLIIQKKMWGTGQSLRESE